MNPSRRPDFASKSRKGLSTLFSEVSLRGLVFDPEDAPSDIVMIAANERAFTLAERTELDGIPDDMFDLLGGGVCEATYPVFTKSVVLRQAA